MGFRLIKGKFAPRLGRPDGDSVRSIPDNLEFFNGLKGKRIRIHDNQGENSVQLRYEGLDTMEKSAAIPWSSQATEANLRLIGGSRCAAGADSRGYILTRLVGPNRRPISFVYHGSASEADGEDVFLDVGRMAKSVNYELLREGHGYPMFYNTLFSDLRKEMANAVIGAGNENKGVWAADRTTSGVQFEGKDSLATMPPIFPKLWRRLRKWANISPNLTGFENWLAQLGEPVEVILSAQDGQFEDVIEVSGDRVRMTELPECLKFRSAGT